MRLLLSIFLVPVSTSWLIKLYSLLGHLRDELVKGWKGCWQTLSLSDLRHNETGLAASFLWIALKFLPVVEDALRGGASTSCGSQGVGEAE
jgi:ABC-type spermidine/putrescine transport system permease subunit I